MNRETQAVATLESQVAQIQRHSAPLQEAVTAIATARLLPPRVSDMPPLADVIAVIARHQTTVLHDLKTKHRSMATALYAVERVVCGSATGRAPGMAAWYTHWEGALCGALVTMVHTGVSRCLVVYTRSS